nr:hypothetical protein [Tanacetum cinerariifolium]
MIKSTIIESLEDVFLVKSSSHPQSTYEAATSLTEFELRTILIDKMEKSQSNLTTDEHKELYKVLVNSYNVDNDLFLVYGKVVSLKRGHKDKDKDEDHPAGSDQGMKRRKTKKDAESLKDRGHQVVPVDYFINNDLEYLWGGSSSKKYTTSTKKIKVAKYDIQGIEDMVPLLWSLEIEVRRKDHQLYKFKEGDFLRLHLHDIEDMLLLLVQKKLSNLEREVIFDLGVALRMFTRRIVILKWVEDL